MEKLAGDYSRKEQELQAAMTRIKQLEAAGGKMEKIAQQHQV